MIKVENIDVWGFEAAVRAMRNPMNSWDKSDSKWRYDKEITTYGDNVDLTVYAYEVGQADLDLMQRLYKAGTEHRTYARMIQVSMDITAPLYWWKEMDRYTVGKSQVSTSTMHKIASKEFEVDDFSFEHLFSLGTLRMIIEDLNYNRGKFIETKNKEYWWQMIQLLPSSYNQKRTVCMSYEVIFKIIKERTGHKLDEWNDFIKELRKLPYVDSFIGNKIAEECPINELLESKGK